jgi:FAD/FMN-containing dehydrogenase/Fe-S oxidoreductase
MPTERAVATDRVPELDHAALEEDLRAHIRGEVRFDQGSRGLYAHDASNYRQVPIGVVIPKDAEDVVRTHRVCREHRAPILARGGGTSLAGQCVNTAVVLDFSKNMHGVVGIDTERRLATVRPGTVMDRLRDEAERHALTFGPDPSTHDRCTVGGMVGNNACGVHAVMSEFYGPGPRMAENVESLEVLTYDGLRMRVGRTSDQELEAIIRGGGRRGSIYAGLRDLRDRYADLIRGRFPDFQRRVSGYNLDELLPERGFNVAGALVGTEGTCVTVLEATVRLLDSQPVRSLALVGFDDVFAAADAVPKVREHRPVALEGFDDVLVDNNRKLHKNEATLDQLPGGNGWLMAEFGGQTRGEADERARAFMSAMRRVRGVTGLELYDDPRREEEIWELRESGLGATAFVPGQPDAWEGWEDAAVPVDRLGSYLRAFRALLDRYGYRTALYGHFGQGCVHCRITFDLYTTEGTAAYRRFVDEAADLVVQHGGSLSGEHGDGQSRAELLPKMFGPDLVRAFGEFKAIWDPDDRMNPGKVVDPYPVTADMKLGPHYRPPEVRTHFSYPEDHGDFAHATLRCVGIGQCRATDSGTMCPSYMVTREEMHSTRGRARLLFEMMNNPDIELWDSDEVEEALDLCLSCKGCKDECPVSVDMATYKAEFLSRRYRGRLRPRAAYALGLIHRWARLASAMPGLANALTHAPALGSALKRLGGVAPQREAPRFAPRTFRSWFASRQPQGPANGTVLLWPDTFSNHIQPGVAAAAVEVLEAAGYRVEVPSRVLCCGRPLYDYGMLDTAERLLRRVLDELRPHIEAGTPVVGVEPSCLAVFRDELPNLFPEDPLASRLSKQTLTLAEFLRREGWEPPPLHRKAIVQGHCHHRAVMGFDADREMLDALGLDHEVLDAGCCGMAGSFGFEAGEKYEVSQAAGERVLLPRVREAPDHALVLADGFSCRTQIEQNTDRRALHLAQAIRMALRDGPGGPTTARPEDGESATVPTAPGRGARLVLAAAALGAAGLLAWRLWRRSR